MNARFRREVAVPRHSRRILATLLLTGAALASGTAAATTYRIVELPLPSQDSELFPEINGINAAGEMVGDAVTPNIFYRSVAWSGPPDYTPRWLPVPDIPYQSIALDINDAGLIIGTQFLDHGGRHAVMWGPNDVPVLFHNPSGASGEIDVDAINNRGVVVGRSAGNLPTFWLGPRNPHVLTNSHGAIRNATPLALNDSGTIVGFTQALGGYPRAFRRTPGAGVELLDEPPGQNGSEAQDVNEAGQAVGVYFDRVTNGPRGVIWNIDGSIMFTVPGDLTSRVMRINNAGEVIGNFYLIGNNVSFRWTAATGLQNFVDLIDPLDPLYPRIVSGEILIFPEAINDAGVVAGIAQDEDKFAPTPIVLVPQP